MSHIYTILTSISPDSPFHEMVRRKRREGEIFISYKSSDVLFASELFCKLAREKRLNVWFDNDRLDIGDQYAEVIPKAIKQAKIFIPILSPSISEELETYGDQVSGFHIQEWRWASENSQIAVFPVAIGGYDLRSPIHKVFEQIIQHQTTGIDMSEKPNSFMVSEKTGFAKLLDSIYKQLGVTEP